MTTKTGAKPTKTQMKLHAQASLMNGIGNMLGYWEEDPSEWPDGWDEWPEDSKQQYRDMMLQQADRVAKLLGFERAWSN